MHFGRYVRDWLLASDPALSRFRLASRVTLTIVVSFLILLVVSVTIHPLPTAAFGLAIVLSIEGGLAVRDTSPSRQRVTRLLGCIASLAVLGIAAALEDHRYVSDFTFLVVILLATSARVFGPRGFAVGMFAFTSYFMGAYFKPSLADLPLVATGPVTAALVGHVVRAVLLPDNWRRDLLSALEAVQARITQILLKLAVQARAGSLSEGDRHDLRQIEERLKDATLMAESLIPRPESGILDGEGDPASELALTLFDAHLAAESAIVLSGRSLPSFPLVHAVLENDRTSMAREEAGLPARDDKSSVETSRAMLWLHAARGSLTQAIESGRRTGFAGIKSAAASSDPIPKPDFSLHNPIFRSALQITLASGIAMSFGLMLSRDRWFWAVLAAFLIFSNTNSRGDTAIKALQRSVGTLLGIAFGLGVATLLAGHAAISIAVAVVSIFLAFYFLQVSYATMTFFVSVVLCLVYGMTGILTLNLVGLRIEETVIGAVAGTAVGFFVFPARTRGAVDKSVTAWFDALEALLATAGDNSRPYHAIDLSQKLDAAYRNLAIAARPLGTSWSIVTRPGHIRQTLAIFLACTYWARIFARNLSRADMVVDAVVSESIAANRARLPSLAARASECFFVKRKAPSSASRHLPLSREGARLGTEMIGVMLDRLYP